MGDRRMELYQSPSDLDPDYDWDYEDEPGPPPPKILWGRVAVIAALALLAGLIGWWAAPNGIPADDFERVKDQRDELREDAEAKDVTIANQEAQIDRLRRQVTQAGAEETQPTETEDGAETVELRQYTIQTGDTLTKIATQFYDDENLADCLAAYNDIETPDQLEIGDDIIIPPEEDVCG